MSHPRAILRADWVEERNSLPSPNVRSAGDAEQACAFCDALEVVPAVLGEVVAVEAGGEIVEAEAELVRGHVRWDEVHIEERAALPSAVVEQAALLLELAVEGGAGEGGGVRDLDVVWQRVRDEVVDGVKDAAGVA